MAHRASWKGYLKLGAVTCAAALHTAQTTTEKVSFNILNARTGNRVRQSMVDEETGEAVDREQQVKGYEVAKGEYVLIEPDEIDSIRIESSHTICIERFIPESQVDQPYLDGSHYLAPDDAESAETFALIRAGMEKRGVAAIGRVVLSSRERLVLLRPRGPGMLMTTLRWGYEVREDDRLFDDIPDTDIDEEMLDLASIVVDRKRGHLDHSECADRYEQALIALIDAKREGRTPDLPKERPPAAVVSLKEALRQSAEAGAGRGAAGPKRRRSA